MLKYIKKNFAFYRYRLPSVSIDDIADPLFSPVEFITEHINIPSPPRPQFNHDDLTPLLRIAKIMKPENILELGTAYGNTTANLCAACNAHVYTINALPEQMSGHFVTFSLKKDEIGKVYRMHGFENRVTQIYENTKIFDHTRYFDTPCIDLAIIDACHDTEFVMSDFKKVLPLLKEKAVVLFHDTHPSMQKHLAGSYIACVELRKEGYDIRHIENTWWGIWRKGFDSEHL